MRIISLVNKINNISYFFNKKKRLIDIYIRSIKIYKKIIRVDIYKGDLNILEKIIIVLFIFEKIKR